LATALDWRGPPKPEKREKKKFEVHFLTSWVFFEGPGTPAPRAPGIPAGPFGPPLPSPLSGPPPPPPPRGGGGGGAPPPGVFQKNQEAKNSHRGSEKNLARKQKFWGVWKFSRPGFYPSRGPPGKKVGSLPPGGFFFIFALFFCFVPPPFFFSPWPPRKTFSLGGNKGPIKKPNVFFFFVPILGIRPVQGLVRENPRFARCLVTEHFSPTHPKAKPFVVSQRTFPLSPKRNFFLPPRRANPQIMK